MSHTISFYPETALFQMRTAVTTHLEESRALTRRKSDPLLSFLSIIALVPFHTTPYWNTPILFKNSYVHIENIIGCIKIVTITRTTVNVCILQTVTWRLVQNLLHGVSFLELWRTTNLLTQFSSSFTILRRNANIFPLHRKRRLPFEPLLTGIPSHGNICCCTKEHLPSMPALSTVTLYEL